MTKILIVGASGYIGSELFKAAKNKFHVNGTSSRYQKDLIRLNLKEAEHFSYELIASDSVVVITAAISAPDVCTNDYSSAFEINVLGTATLIANVLERGSRVIFFSSDAVYGECSEICDERSPPKPLGEYARMKHEIETRFESNSRFKSLRLSYVFSREDKFTKYLLKCANKKIEADIFHPFYRSVVYLQDVIEGVIALIENWDKHPQSIINFGGAETISRIKFAETFNQRTQLGMKFTVTEPSCEFFSSRPRSIAMRSPYFKILLGRLPLNLDEAMHIELPLHELQSNIKFENGKKQ